MNKLIMDESYTWERRPKNQKYISCNFETVGNCPRCGKTVVCGIGYIEERCKSCDLKLFWGQY